jgi:hypothetical protein
MSAFFFNVLHFELSFSFSTKVHVNFQWMLGNYSQSVNQLLDCHLKSLIEESSIPGDTNVFADPGVGQYCAIIATKSSFRNCVGEAQSANLSKLSLAMASCALNRCGLPVSILIT